MNRSLSVGSLGAVLFMALLAGPTFAQIFDSDNVVLLSRQDDFLGYNDVWGFVGSDGREYMIQGLTTGTAWWDIDDPVNPVLVDVIPGPTSGWRDMFVIGDYCYVGTEGGGGIQVIDISDPTDPNLVNVYNLTVGQTHNIFGDVARELIFTVGGFSNGAQGGLQILDVSDPFNIVEIGRWTNQYIHDLSAEGNLLYLCLINTGRFKILDVTDPTNPVGFGSNFADPTGSVHASWPVGNGTHVMIAEETGGGHVKSLDISNPNAIFIADAYNAYPAASAHNVHVEGSRAYVAWYGVGTRILDVTNPASLSEIGHLDTFPDSDGGGVGPGNWGVYPHLPSGVIASSDRPSGMFLWRHEPDAGILNGTIFSSEGGPLSGATATYENLTLDQITDASGLYRFSGFPGGTHTIAFSAFGFEPDTIQVGLPVDGTTTTDVTLTKLPSGGVQGTIRDAISGDPIEAADVQLIGSPDIVVTDGTGTYAFPDVPSDSYALRVLRYGFAVPHDLPVTIQTGVVATLDVDLEPAPFFEDFSSATGWTVSDVVFASSPDSATGTWEIGDPFGTYTDGIPLQPEFDHTLDPENQCAVTGNAPVGQPSGDDVDSLSTSLLSPAYDLSGMSEPHVFYYRWHAIDVEDEPFLVEATADGGANWITLESSLSGARAWTGVDVDLTGLLSSQAAVQFRFTASDPDETQLLEAAVDDFSIYDANPGAVDAPHVPVPGVVARLELAQNSPNPFRADTAIRFSIPAAAAVELSVFDVRGARVAVLADGVLEAGVHEVSWDGRTYTGGLAADGVYFYKLQTDREIRTRKMLRLN